MNKTKLRREIEQGETYVFGEKNLVHDKMNKVTSYVVKRRVLDLIDQLDEPEEPVIPQFVGEWIENAKEDECSLSKAFWLIFSNAKNTGGNVTENWIYDNPGLFACAWLFGYTVEEKKYEVKFCTGGTLQGNPSLIVLYESVSGEILAKEMTTEHYRNFKERVPSSYHLTEKQIKDYNFRFWPFAEEVTQ